ncbi:MAG: hypothetical protein OXK76_01865 [Gammaproteobacteria bacterium]|nr:hypothetical protein [Gammaproteobacteria bacterium]
MEVLLGLTFAEEEVCVTLSGEGGKPPCWRKDVRASQHRRPEDHRHGWARSRRSDMGRVEIVE